MLNVVSRGHDVKRFHQSEADCHSNSLAAKAGFHATASIDYVVILSGEIDLELDTGVKMHLRRIDVVMQNGRNHAWRNTGKIPCIVAAVCIGARRER
ncbi:MAG TPA: hypothetical protein VE398_16820 [Acidobacteriota bacterium]|nr:hypothetical protein [Acidobacteriota bacterium]